MLILTLKQQNTRPKSNNLPGQRWLLLVAPPLCFGLPVPPKICSRSPNWVNVDTYLKKQNAKSKLEILPGQLQLLLVAPLLCFGLLVPPKTCSTSPNWVDVDTFHEATITRPKSKLLPEQLRLLLVAPPPKTCARSPNSINLDTYRETAKYRAKIRNLAWATVTPSCGTAAMLWAGGACDTCSRSPNWVNVDTYPEATKCPVKVRKSCLGNCDSSMWNCRYALHCRCLPRHVQEVRIASILIITYLEAAKYQAKIKTLACATVTPSCGTAAMLWTAGACDTCSRSPNSVNVDIYLAAAKYQAKGRNLAWATATPPCGTAAMLWTAGASQDMFNKSELSRRWYFPWSNNNQAKIRFLAWATATPSFGTAAMLWAGGACDTCSRSPNWVNADTYPEATKCPVKVRKLCLGNCDSFLWHRRYALDCWCLRHMFKKSELSQSEKILPGQLWLLHVELPLCFALPVPPKTCSTSPNWVDVDTFHEATITRPKSDILPEQGQLRLLLLAQPLCFGLAVPATHVQEVRIESMLILTLKQQNAQSKWENLAWATATPSFGTAAMLWAGGACDTCSRSPNWVNADTYPEATKCPVKVRKSCLGNCDSFLWHRR